MKFKILAADDLSSKGLDYIRDQSDAELVHMPRLSEDELVEIVGEFDGLIVRSGARVTERVLANPGRLKIVARAGVGVDNIDLEAATAAGVLVINSAEASTITTAEHAFALMLALARHIGPAYKTMTEGGWERNRFQGRQLAGKTLGVVGFGRIGQTVAERALGFAMKVIAYDPFINAETMMDGQVHMHQKFTEILPHADILTFHVPLNEHTRGMLGKNEFANHVKQGVLVVNASRGGVVDEHALLSALEHGTCGGAALDVFTSEPPPTDHPPGFDHGLRDHPKILTTPHLGASTVEAQEAVNINAAMALLDYLRGQGVRGAVNVAGLHFDLDPLQGRYVDLSLRMAMLLSPMITTGIKKVTFEVAGQALASAAATIERMAMIGLLQPNLDTRLNLVNVRHVAEHRGIVLRTLSTDDEKTSGPQITIEVESANRIHRIVGHVYRDMRPRVAEINGYHMDLVPAGNMVLVRNDDRPGIIGRVGTEFGNANINIANMAISRRGNAALMVLCVDNEPPTAIVDHLLAQSGIQKVAVVKLPEEGSQERKG